MALTDTEKSNIRRYLGYPELEAATVYQQGMPRTIETSFVLEQNMLNLTTTGITQVRGILAQIATSRTEIDASLGRLKASELKGIVLNPKELDQRKKHDRWLIGQLAAVLAVKLLDDCSAKVRIR